METRIFNSSLTRELVDVAKIQTATDPIPSEIASKVVPVIDVNPKHARVTKFSSFVDRVVSGADVVYTSASNVDTYITNATISYSKDATCDVANGVVIITFYVGGKKYYWGGLAISSLQAQNDSISIHFTNPILIDRGSVIDLNSNTYTVGTMSRAACVQGYTVENINA